MSGGDKITGNLGEIKEIYLFLTKGEPSPDDEIEARETLIKKFIKLMENDQFSDQRDQIEGILRLLEDWDTLDLWFVETPIPRVIEQLLDISSKPSIPHKQVQIPSHQEELTSKKSDIDISEIVDKVSQQFKGEIDVLKDTIETLKKEIDKKDEVLQDFSHKKRVQKFSPKKESNLPPLKIKIPIIKKTVPNSEEIKESIPPIPPVSPVKKPIGVQISQKVEKKRDLSPIPVKPPELEPIKTNQKALTPIPVKKPEITTTVIEESKDKPLKTEKIRISTSFKEKEIEKPIEGNKDNKKPFSVEKPRISSVRIEEVESETIKSSGLDLFDVLSSVGENIKPTPKKRDEQVSKETKSQISSKEVANKAKPELINSQISTFVDFNSKPDFSEDLTSTENLSNDKDTLYQELIALEGKRYAIEKKFKDLETSYNKGSISDMQFKNNNEEIKIKMQEITTRINTIRRLISSL